MPYKIESQSSQCPSSKPFAVCKTTDGKVVPGGCHTTHAEALAHQRAMMVNVPDARGSFVEMLAHDSALSESRAQLGRTVAFAEQFATEEYGKTLSTKDRNNLPDSAFVFPDTREYPIQDLAHARNALSRAAQNETGDRLAKVRSTVYRKYPQLKGDT